MRLLFALILVFGVVTLTATAPARAAEDIPAAIDARTAHRLASEDRLVIVDVRDPKEWRETGVAEGARTITMHQKASQFFAGLGELMGTAGDRRVALICAVGGRTAYLQKVLAARGISVVTVADGMMGSPAGPGWIAAKLPVVPVK